jgi:hypothetical protein
MGDPSSHEAKPSKSPSTVQTLIHPLIAKIAETLRIGKFYPGPGAEDANNSPRMAARRSR